MTDLTSVQPGAEVIDAEGGHVGTVDRVDGNRMHLVKSDSMDGQLHKIDGGLVASVDGETVKLAAVVANEHFDDCASTSGDGLSDNARLEEGLKETFPASDPVSAKHIS